MEKSHDSNIIYPPTNGDDCLKVFLSNLDGRIDTQDLHTFFSPFGTIEHIESWTHKSAVILFSHIDSVDRVLATYRKCIINKQEIYIRRFRYGYIERACMDSNVLFIKPIDRNPTQLWNSSKIRDCFREYEENIDKIRLISKANYAYVYFKDYDIVDRILLQANHFRIDGMPVEVKRAKLKENFKENHDTYVERLLEKNKLLRKQIERQKNDARHEIISLKHKINRLKYEMFDLKVRYRSFNEH